jgi:lycopene beta-cyclase
MRLRQDRECLGDACVSSGRADVVIVGGGLASGLTALRIRALRPDCDVVVVEQKPPGAIDHTWSFFHSDLDAATRSWLLPLAAVTWPGYSVRFPHYARRLATGYASIVEAQLASAVDEALGSRALRGVHVADLSANVARLSDGHEITAPLVIDARGARPTASLSLAWQKFVGLEVRLAGPHGLDGPIVMDADLPQLDGYRFLYVLPFDETRLLVEDTRYSDGDGLDLEGVAADALAYAATKGWRVAEVIRREHGVLPIALGGDIDAFWDEQAPGVPSIGMRSAMFHPTTGYSLPDAARLADLIAAAPILESGPVLELVRERSKHLWRERAFFRALNRMLFLAAKPDQRWRVLARFYRLPQPIIERFFAARPTFGDQLRTVIGKPPVPVRAALSAVVGGARHA